MNSLAQLVLFLQLLALALAQPNLSGEFHFHKARNLPELEPGPPQEIIKRQGRGNTDFNEDEAEAIVERHNYHRANTKWSASNMRHMVRKFI